MPLYIKEARVLLYGYNSQVPNSRSTATYGEMASVLLKSLCRIRYETNVSLEDSISSTRTPILTATVHYPPGDTHRS